MYKIARDEPGVFSTPFEALRQATKLHREWVAEGAKKVRILVNHQILTLKQAESWANEEYRELPKCESCAKILNGPVFTHKYCKSNLFCSQECADKDYDYIVSQWDEETECDL